MNKYFEFLCNIIGGAKNYSVMLDTLHKINFYSIIPHDANRGADGLRLREVFCDEEGQQALSFCPIGPCTVFEMMIGLCKRLQFDTANSRWEKSPGEWFWILVDNLGLTEYDDITLESSIDRSEMLSKITRMLNREYDYNGNGGLFPLSIARKDQRTVEIWYQMSAYILQNYPI